MSKNLIENEDYQIVTPSENGLFTVATLNTNSESNSGLLEDFQNVDDIPIIPISTNSCFDLENLPETETLNELLSNLCELMIRFDGCVKDYQKSDYEHLIKTITNALIHLYTQNQAIIDLEYVIHFMGIANTSTNPINDAISTNHKYPGMYILSEVGEYINFGLVVTEEELKNSIIYAVPNIVDGIFLNYNKINYDIVVNTKLSEFENDTNFISEAPNDGKQYVRKSNSWEEIDSSQFGTVKSVNNELPDENGNVQVIIPINTFENDLIVSLPDGKTLGKYESGQTIPSAGKTAEEVFNLIAVEAINPTVTLTTTTPTIPFNTTTSHNKILNFSYIIKSLNGVVSTVKLEWKRANESIWQTLTTDASLTTYTHSYTDSELNTNAFNYRYTVIDDKGGSTTATLNITIISYVAPTTNINETITKERGDVETLINGTITVNSVNCPILTRTLKVSTDNITWVDINIPESNTISYTHNDDTYLDDSILYYRLTVTDIKQTTDLAIGTITFVYKSVLGYSIGLSGTSQDMLNTILSFGNSSLTNNKNRTINGITASGGKYTYYAYASSAGNLTSIIQDGAAPVLGAFTKLSDITGVNSFGADVTYRIYKSNASDAFTNNSLAFS